MHVAREMAHCFVSILVFGSSSAEKQSLVSSDLTSLNFIPAPVIPVKSSSDAYDHDLTSMLLLSWDRMLLADSNNYTVKLVDLQTNRLVSQVSVAGDPWGMCLLPGDRAAVSVQSGSIQFLETQRQFSLGDTIKVDGDCRGIGYHDNCLIVSYNGGKVEKVNMKGEMLMKVSKDLFSRNQFKDPQYLTVVNEGPTTAIYVSESQKNTITKLDVDLNILQIFSDPALRFPQGITAVGNKLLICGKNSNNIMCLDLPSGKMTQLLGQKKGILDPRSVCYSQQDNKLFVSCYVDVKVYKAS